MADIIPYLLTAYATYLVGAASPGPSNLTIMQTAMQNGRVPGLFLAWGVALGSMSWGMMATLGVAGILAHYPGILWMLKCLGACYFLWLAYRSWCAASVKGASDPKTPIMRHSQNHRHFIRGLAFHLTNPKALFVWLAIIALGWPEGAPFYVGLMIVGGCGLMGIIIFTTYALVFSSSPAIALYRRIRRPFEYLVTALFGAAAFRMISSAISYSK